MNDINKVNRINRCSYLIKKGIIKIPKYCFICKSRGKLDAHHTDNSSDNVVFVCKICHRAIHGGLMVKGCICTVCKRKNKCYHYKCGVRCISCSKFLNIAARFLKEAANEKLLSLGFKKDYLESIG